ncbi:U3-containing 90S pre-ribosomal complex subunit-domain containing protein [Sporodiniella umbellata]|nr:U3-containing 90S pre-ribosomal complex subunit-domain containing protein [Sporodiniella umbellata]
MAGGDDFEDDFQEETVFSDSEPVVEEDKALATSAKRKDISESEEKPKKKKKKPSKKKTSSNPFDTIEIWKESVQTQAEYFNDRQKIALPNLSDVELEEQTLPESAIVNNEKFKQEHILDALPNYIKFGVAGHKKLSKKPMVSASPVALVVTHSAIRAVDLVRSLKDSFDSAKIAKLFAKHFKIEEQVDFLEREPIHIGVGTPNRLQALVDQGHLNLSNLELVVIDTEKNAKKFNIFDIQDVRSDLFNFLGLHISQLTKENRTKIGLF